MANEVYNIVCDALSRLVSHRAAENIVSDALRGAKLSPQTVRPEQMQALLKSVVFARLQQIIPVAQAKGEIRQILNALEAQFLAAQTFSPEVEEGWIALRGEFARVTDQRSPRAQRLQKSIAQLPQSNDPVRILNDLWAELDLLQLELSPNSAMLESEPRYQGDLLLESGEFSVLNFELEHLAGPAEVPALGRPGTSAVSRIDQDLNLTIIDEIAPVIPVSVKILDTSPIAPLEFDFEALGQIPIQPLTVPPAAGLTVPPAAGLTVPPAAGLTVPPSAKPTKPILALFETPAAQEALLTRFALEEGVTGVLLSKRNGDVIASRLSSGSASHLAGVVAATTMLLAKRRHFRVFYTHLESVSAFIAPLGEQLLTVLADAGVNVGRVFTELESLKETA